MLGKRQAARQGEWDPTTHTVPTAPDAPFLTKAAAHYPMELNWRLAEALLRGVLQFRLEALRAAASVRATKVRPCTSVEGARPTVSLGYIHAMGMVAIATEPTQLDGWDKLANCENKHPFFETVCS